jgi:hypothetical protein
MDQAIYRAELLRDGADKRALTQIINLYAMDHRRWYPYRPPRTGDTPRHLAGNAAEGAVTGARLDVRPQLRPYLDINRFFNDPFVEEPVDYDRPSSDNAYIWASIHFFFGYSHWEGRGMTKLGTRWTIGGSWNAADRDFGFSVMIGCRDYIFGTALAVEGSHPDKEGLMTSFSQQEEQGFPAAYTNAGWSSNIGRGPVDLNFVLADESLSQWNDVVQDRTNFRPDDRMAWIPTNSYYAGTNYLTIPYE